MMMDASIYHYFIIDDDDGHDADDGCIYISLYHYFNGWLMMDASIISINYQLSLMDGCIINGWMMMDASIIFKGHQQDNMLNINKLGRSVEPADSEGVTQTALFLTFGAQKNDRKMIDNFEKSDKKFEKTLNYYENIL